jgi:trk system potassium uptake protein TrkH
LGITAFSNTGPSIGWLVGPPDSWGVLSDPVLWINFFLMLAGRLEIFSLLLPFAPAFWKEQ